VHTGLVALSAVIGGDTGSMPQRYRQAASACEALGLSPLAEFYEALARGAQPPVPWGSVLESALDSGRGAAKEQFDGAV